MKGSITGAVIGSQFIDIPHFEKQFPLIFTNCHATDAVLGTIAMADWLTTCKSKTMKLTFSYFLKNYATLCPKIEFPDEMKDVLDPKIDIFKPISKDLGLAAAIVSPISYFAETEAECEDLVDLALGDIFTCNRTIEGAELIARLIFKINKARRKNEQFSKEKIREFVLINYSSLPLSVENYRESTKNRNIPQKFIFSGCLLSVPKALVCFLESADYEDCIRNCVSIGGNPSLVGSIAGGIAEAYYGMSDILWKDAKSKLDVLLQARLDGLID